MIGHSVAPARERGLKLLWPLAFLAQILRRSREGAWIEITTPQGNLAAYGRRSREGAWIEIQKLAQEYMMNVGRSREGAWIEMVAGEPNSEQK